MQLETFKIEISVAERGRSYGGPQILDSFEIESDNIFKDVAKIISEQDVFAYRNGLYFKVENIYGKEEKFWAANKGETMFVRYCSNQYDRFSAEYTDWDIEPRYLTCLDETKNEYKYYLMTFDKNADNFNVQYGRIGMVAGEFNYKGKDASKDGSYEFPAPMFWIKYYEKIAKGYEDKTELKDFSKTETARRYDNTEYDVIEEEEIRKIIDFLVKQQREYVQRSFDISVPFSQQAIDISRNLLSEMSKVVASDNPDKENEFKKLYKELVVTLPRKIYNVGEYINRVSFRDKESENYIDNVLNEEKELFDNFCDLFEDKPEEKEHKTAGTILDNNGMKANVPDFKDKWLVLDKMGEDAHRVRSIIEVTNTRTKDAYDKAVKELGIEPRGRHLLWHGSRTENWWSIAKNGMSLNPNAVITGKMFGQGLYFAPKAQKSMGYTDMKGSYWAGGTSKTGYLALFEVAMGKPFEPAGALSCSFNKNDLRHGCHSVWAYPQKTGLRNEECIVYREDQCNLKYLVELDSERTRSFSFDIKKARKLHCEKPIFEDNCIVVSVPDFDSKCNMNFKNVTFEYDVDKHKMQIYPASLEAKLNISDKDYLTEIFMSRFADNKKEFELIADEIKEYGDIPKDIKKQFDKNSKGKENVYDSRTA